jgi:hypothetical protein
MDTLDEHQKKYLEYLLADFGAIKAEIARRSNLQRIVLAAYIAVIAVVGKEASSYSLTAPLLMGLWISGALAFQFYTREGLEIGRLGSIIRERIAPVASRILGVQTQDLLHSESNAAFPNIDKITARYDRQFKWSLFFILPVVITVFYLSQDWSRLQKLLNIYTKGPYIGLGLIVSCLWTLNLLRKYT